MIDFFQRRFRAMGNISTDYGAFADRVEDPTDWCEMSPRATLVTSRLASKFHAPVIDIDVPHHYEASSTPGHGHLYLNKPMTFDAMCEILDVLTKHGIVEPGFAKATKMRGYASVRTPWTRK